MIEHVGRGTNHGLDRPLLAQEVGREHFDRGRAALRADRADHAAKCPAPPSSRFIAVDRGHHDNGKTELRNRSGDMRGLRRIERPREPVLTLQNAQARVHVSP